MNVLILGASRGIGLEFARQYRAEGARVVATARDEAGLARLQALGCESFALDVRDTASTAGLAWRLDGERFDLVIVNAGVYGPRTQGLESPSQAEFDQVMHTNVLGPMRVIPTVAPTLGAGARLAVLSSMMGSIAQRGSPSAWLYRASKAALNSVLKDTSLVLATQDVICVALHPGWVQTDMGGAEASLTPEHSVSDLRRLLAGLKASDNGAFLNHDGTPIPW